MSPPYTTPFRTFVCTVQAIRPAGLTPPPVQASRLNPNHCKRPAYNNSLINGAQFWQNGNRPAVLYTAAVIEQRIDYMHGNPIRAGFVDSAHEYW